MKSNRGFTLVEMLVVITIIGILAAIAIPNMTKARNKAKESEVKAALHVIQEAIERYNTDEGEYPAYLLGGNRNSWPVFYVREPWHDPDVDLIPPDYKPIFDPLIRYAYISTYPKNVFVDQQLGGVYLKASGGDELTPASGDPRFGVDGTIMLNTVDDPILFETTIDELAETINEAGLPTMINYGEYGGFMGASGQPRHVTIPGTFFYRAEGSVNMADLPTTLTGTKRDFPYQSYSRYMLGGFGHQGTLGIDIYRITGEGLNYSHRILPDVNFPYDVPLMLPEVFGAGGPDAAGVDIPPFFPYEPLEEGIEFYYGAPDSFVDGVILILTDSGWSRNF